MEIWLESIELIEVIREGLLEVKKNTIAEATTTIEKPTDKALKARTPLKNIKATIVILQTYSKETIQYILLKRVPR